MATPNSIPDLAIDNFTYSTYEATANHLKSVLPSQYHCVKVGIICGSGLGGLSQLLSEPVTLPYATIPNFAQSTVQGHTGALVFGLLNKVPCVCMVGRKHLYEGHAPIRTTFPIRIMSLMGVETLIVTNAAGGLNPDFNIGDIMVIEDHISFAGLGGLNSLIGKNIEQFGPRFPPVSDAYDEQLRISAFQSAKKVGLDFKALRQGVYSFVSGPSFETRAEARYLRNSGGDCVGMSTVPEVIVARHCGIKVLGLSLITNRVATKHGLDCKAYVLGETDANVTKELPASHAEVLETSSNRSKDMQTLVGEIVANIGK